jgi:hypothetical protein
MPKVLWTQVRSGFSRELQRSADSKKSFVRMRHRSNAGLNNLDNLAPPSILYVHLESGAERVPEMSLSFEHNPVEDLAFDDEIVADERVRREYYELNRLLAKIDDIPVSEQPVTTDSNWTISDYEVSGWRIVVKGNTRLDRIAEFRSELQQHRDIIDARVERFDCGEIVIRLVTTGGIPMGPLERAVWGLTRDKAQITQTK